MFFSHDSVVQNRRLIFTWGEPYDLIAVAPKNLTFTSECGILKIVRTFYGPPQRPQEPPNTTDLVM